jgi:hypothetical protein
MWGKKMLGIEQTDDQCESTLMKADKKEPLHAFNEWIC